MQKLRPTHSQPSMFRRLISVAQKAIVFCPRRTKKIPNGSTAMRLPRTRLSPRPLLALINLRPKTLKNATEVDKETIQPSRSMQPR